MKGFCFYQSLEAAIEKCPKAACHEKPPSSSRRSLCVTKETSQRKTGRKPEENWWKIGGKHFENSLKKSIKKQDQNRAKKKNLLVLPISMEIQTT